MANLFCQIPSDVQAPPQYIINLDEAPSIRWKHIASLYIERLQNIEKTLETTINSMIGTWSAPIVEKVVTTFMAGITRLGLVYYGEELKGISEVTGIALGRLALIQFVYECSAFCTSIVCRDPVTNVPLHIRTMDWGMNFLNSLTIDVDFQQQGRSVLKATTWIGYVGILTGMRTQNGYSISVNFRNIQGALSTNLKTALSNGWPIGFLVREILEKTSDFHTAVEQLAQSSVIAPCYFIVCGTSNVRDPGALITRRQTCEENRWTLNNHGNIVQTNIDHWEQDPDHDILESITHRKKARELLKPMTSINEEALWKLVSQKPIMDQITIYATFMCPEYGIYHTRLPNRERTFVSKEISKFLSMDTKDDKELSSASPRHYSCAKCNQNFSLENNNGGSCVHIGTWHRRYEDCSYVKCGFQLVKKSAIGVAHWSCCYSLDLLSNRCTKSLPHTFLSS